MQKLNLVAMSYDRDAILNALQETNAVEVKLHSEEEGSVPLPAEGAELKEYLSSLENTLATLVSEAENYAKEHKLKPGFPKDGFEVSYTEFLSAPTYKERAEAVSEQVGELVGERNEKKAQLNKLQRTLKTAEIYAAVNLPLNTFCATAYANVRLGTIPMTAWDDVKKRLDLIPLAAYYVYATSSDNVLVGLVEHKGSKDAEDVLQSAGFTPCPFAGEQTGAQLYETLLNERAYLLSEIGEDEKVLYDLGENIRMLKIYCDYLGIELEKAQTTEKLRGTERTFLLEAYVPSGAEEKVREALSSVSGAVYFEFSEPADDEVPPTLLKNNAVVSNFETVTNMYSPPSHKDFDPNTVMAFFYSVFLGFIMADIGYGLIMLLGGGLVWWKNRERQSGLKSLAGVFAVGGILAIVWGVLFNSLFGIAVLPFTVMPNAQSAMWSFLGISIPSVLIIALLIGVVQLMTGYLCRFVQCVRWGRVLDGIFDGLIWAIFSLGALLALVGLVEEFHLSSLAMVGGIIAGAALAVAVLTAGRKEKLIGKFTKGFGALYSVINYASDILSYARLYGLMLSGAVIAQIISQYAVTGANGSVGFLMSGNVLLIILGIVLMVVGHLFNLAISLLGAYIHDARLQYVEFYGRFYVGEGELFAPLGSKHKYVWVVPQKQAAAVKTAALPQTATNH